MIWGSSAPLSLFGWSNFPVVRAGGTADYSCSTRSTIGGDTAVGVCKPSTVTTLGTLSAQQESHHHHHHIWTEWLTDTFCFVFLIHLLVRNPELHHRVTLNTYSYNFIYRTCACLLIKSIILTYGNLFMSSITPGDAISLWYSLFGRLLSGRGLSGSRNKLTTG